MYLPACSVLLFWSLWVIIDSKRSGRIYIRAKEVMGGEANTFLFGARIRTEHTPTSERVSQNEKWKM